ncbi:MAG: hypothetical protein JO110_17655 [Acetobacteraceae bacterium]|nr:hypothetical protein [Acetobacteraceae bacterium]
MKGRKPTPISILKTRGTLRKGRHGKRMQEPKPSGDLSEPPEWLTPSQQEIWREAVANAPAGVLKEIDQGVLTVWVTAVDQHRTAIMQQAKLDADARLPLLVKSRDGAAAPSPYLRVATRAADLMLGPRPNLDLRRHRAHGLPARAQRPPRLIPTVLGLG